MDKKEDHWATLLAPIIAVLYFGLIAMAIIATVRIVIIFAYLLGF